LPVIPERHRGCPHKEKENQLKGFKVSAVVKIAQLPKHVKGKTTKGNKWVKQEPLRLGPFSFTEWTSWFKLLEEVQRTAYISKEQIVLTAMTWCPNKSTNNSLPLTDLGGYQFDRSLHQKALQIPSPSTPQGKCTQHGGSGKCYVYKQVYCTTTNCVNECCSPGPEQEYQLNPVKDQMMTNT
jgi:hypothetical protein